MIGVDALTLLTDPGNFVVPKGMLEHPLQDGGSRGDNDTVGRRWGMWKSGWMLVGMAEMLHCCQYK